MLIVKYKINPEFRYSCTVVNNWIIGKISGIDILYSNYVKLSQMIYNYASKDMQR